MTPRDQLLDRRHFLASSAALFLAFHGEGWSAAARELPRAPSPQPAAPDGRGPRIRSLKLKTHALAELRDFYGGAFGFPVLAETPASVTFAAGATRLEFERVEDGSKPYYHFAWNIPENKLEAAIGWLEKRVPILRHKETGEQVVHFREWNAHSLFFYDPAGNLGELIARHTLPNATSGPFGLRDLLYASEIGLVPPDQEGTFASIRDRLAIAPYLASSTFLGDEYGLLIVIPKERLWIPEFKKAGVLAPTRITVAGHGRRELRFPDLPFEILGEG